MTLPSSHRPDSSSVSSTPRTGTGNGNGGTNHLHPPSLPPAPAAPPAQAAHVGSQVRLMCSFGDRILPRPGDCQVPAALRRRGDPHHLLPAGCGLLWRPPHRARQGRPDRLHPWRSQAVAQVPTAPGRPRLRRPAVHAAIWRLPATTARGRADEEDRALHTTLAHDICEGNILPCGNPAAS
ncbi:unnamed protein product [Urochloa humidicola]